VEGVVGLEEGLVVVRLPAPPRPKGIWWGKVGEGSWIVRGMVGGGLVGGWGGGEGVIWCKEFMVVRRR